MRPLLGRGGRVIDPAQGLDATRESLEALYHRYQASAESPAYSEVLRAEAQRLAAGVQQRLENGDFQIGDRIRLAVERETGQAGRKS